MTRRSRPANGHSRALLAGFLALLSVLGLVVGMAMAEDGIQFFLFGVSTLSMLIICLPVIFGRNYFLPEPLSYVIFSVFIGLFLKTFYVILGYSTNLVVSDRLLLGLGLGELQLGGLVILTAISLFVLGYSLPLGSPHIARGLRGYRFSEGRLIAVSCIILVLSTVFFALLVGSVGFRFDGLSDLSQKRFLGEGRTPSDRFGNVGYYYYRLTLLSKAPMYLLFYLCLRQPGRWKSFVGMLFYAALVLNLAVAFFVSNKAGLVLPLADLLVITYIVRGRLDPKLIAITVFAMVSLMGLVAVFRGGEAVSSLSTIDKIFGNRYFIELTKTAHIVNSVPNIVDYFGGRSFIAWLNPLLPSDWKFESIYFSDMGFYLGYAIFGNAFSGVTPGIIAELYLNFGFLGVVFGMLIVGMVLKWAHKTLYPHLGHIAAIIVYAIVVVRIPAFLFNGSFGTTLIKTALDLLIMATFLMVVFTQRGSGVR